MDYEHALEIAEGLTNPAWEFIKDIPDDRLMGGWGGRIAKTYENFDYQGDVPKFYRSYVTSRWAWAIPSPDAIARILVSLDGRPVVEVGAGNGYWAWMLSQAGVDIKAYDIAPVGHDDSWFKPLDEDEGGGRTGSLSGFEQFVHEEFFPVKEGGPEVLKWVDNTDRALFLCWPTMSSFAAEAVAQHQGDLVVYIGESESGCNADSEFFWLVNGTCGCWESDYEDGCPHAHLATPDTYVAEYHEIAQWGGLHDNLVFYAKGS